MGSEPLFVWKSEYSVNIKVIDEQHLKLVDTINMLHDAMKSGKNKEVLPVIFDNLAEYVGTHFSTEENFMTMYGYPHYREHKIEHEKCSAKVSEFQKQYKMGRATLSIELVLFLINWLHDHLLNMDKGYSKFLNEKGVF